MRDEAASRGLPPRPHVHIVLVYILYILGAGPPPVS